MGTVHNDHGTQGTVPISASRHTRSWITQANRREAEMSLTGKVILLTGGTSGIGEGCARHYAEQAAKVVFASNQEQEGRGLEEELQARGLAARFVCADISDEDSVKGMVATAVEHYGRIDCLHANAGVWRQGLVTDFTEDDFNFVMGINVKGTFLTVKHTVPVMEKQGQGVVVITTSVAAFIGFPAHALYCASKAALEALVRCLATDHAGVIRAVAVCPGTIDTPMLAATCAGWDTPKDELYADVARKIPVRRMGQPVDVAKAAAFLMSDDAEYISGCSLLLDGGTMALPPW